MYQFHPCYREVRGRKELTCIPLRLTFPLMAVLHFTGHAPATQTSKTHVVTNACLTQKKRRNRYSSRRMLVCTLHTTTSFHHQSLIAPLSKHTQHTLSHHSSERPIHGKKNVHFHLDVFRLSSILLVSSICASVLFSFLLWYVMRRHTHEFPTVIFKSRCDRNSSVRPDLNVQLFTSFHPWLSYKRCNSVPCFLHIWHLSSLLHVKLCNFP